MPVTSICLHRCFPATKSQISLPGMDCQNSSPSNPSHLSPQQFLHIMTHCNPPEKQFIKNVKRFFADAPETIS